MIGRHAIYSNSLHEKGKLYAKGNTRLSSAPGVTGSSITPITCYIVFLKWYI